MTTEGKRVSLAGAPAVPLDAEPISLSTNRRWRAFRQNGVMLAGLAIVLLFLLVALFAPAIAPYDPLQSFPGNRLRPPSERFLFGTDDFSRDVLSRTIFGTRISMTVGLSVAALCAIIGGVIGLLTGYYRAF